MTAFAPLLGLLEAVPDPRRAEGKVYRLPHMLLFSILAIVSGGNSYRSVATFIDVHRRRLNRTFGLETVRNFVWGGVDQVMAKRSWKRMANCALAALHSFCGIFQSLDARFNTRKSSFSAASSCGKWPRARTARRSLALSDSIALVV